MSLQKMKDMELIPQSESQCFFVRKGDLLFILPPIKLRELYKKNIPKMVYGNKKNLMTPKAPTHCSNENETLFGQNGCNTTQREHTHIQKNDDDQQYIWVHNPHQLARGKLH